MNTATAAATRKDWKHFRFLPANNCKKNCHDEINRHVHTFYETKHQYNSCEQPKNGHAGN
jgi:hypothetical protein